MKKTGVFFVSNVSLPVDVGRSKTPLLETLIYKKNTSAVILCYPASSSVGVNTATVTKTSLKKLSRAALNFHLVQFV